MSILRTFGKMAASAAGMIPFIGDDIGNTIDALFGNDQESVANRAMDKQTNESKEMAEWNMQNVTMPLFEAENAEWDRRFAKQNRQWLQQFITQNEWNRPAAQIARLREAGINPAGIGGINNPIAQGSDVSAPYTPQAAGYPAQVGNYADAMKAAASQELTEAQAKNIEQNTEKQKLETDKQEIENKYLDAYWSGNLTKQGVEIDLAKANKDLTNEQREEVKQNVKYLTQKTENARQELINMQEELAQTKEKIENTKASTKYQELVNKWYEKNQEENIKKIWSEIRKNYATEAEAYARAKMIHEQERNFMLTGDYQQMVNNILDQTQFNQIEATNAKWLSETATFKLQSKKANWENREKIYRIAFDTEQALKEIQIAKEHVIQEQNEFGAFGAKIKWNEYRNTEAVPWSGAATPGYR